MKINYEGLKPEDINELDEVEFEIDKDAFGDVTLDCRKCNIKMKRIITDFKIPKKKITISFEVFKCHKCHKESLNFVQAEKMDELLEYAYKRQKGMIY